MISRVLNSALNARTHFDELQGLFGSFSGSLAKDHCLGYFGELGAGLASFLPYLKFLNKFSVHHFTTVGVRGSAPFFESVSNDHIELAVDVSGTWGSRATGLRALGQLRKIRPKAKLLTPQDHVPRSNSFVINGWEWESPEIHSLDVGGSHYACLDWSNLQLQEANELIGGIGPYVVINAKNHFNWGNANLMNHYTQEDLRALVPLLHNEGFQVLLNRPPLPREENSIYFDDAQFVKEANSLGVLDLGAWYLQLSSLSKINAAQIQILRNARGVYASQGGNANLALVCSRDVKILMRAGHDYPDYLSMAKRYGASVEIVFEVNQFASLPKP